MAPQGATPQAGVGSLEEFVRAARRRAALASLARSAAIAALAASVCSAAIEFDGGDSLARAAWVAAALGGALAGAVWWREERSGEREFVRNVDARLELEGALATAADAQCAKPSSMAALLARRTASRLSAGDLLRAAPLPAIGWLAAPLLGWALWLAADQARPPTAPQLARLAAEVGASLAASTSLERAPAEAARELAAGLEAAAAQARTDPAELEAQVQGLAARLGELAQDPGTSPEAALELAAAAQRLSAASHELHAQRRGASTAGAGSADAPLASEPDRRTMMGSTALGPGLRTPADERDSTRSPQTPLQGSAAPLEPREPPVLSGRWWAAEHDAVVAAWREGR